MHYMVGIRPKSTLANQSPMEYRPSYTTAARRTSGTQICPARPSGGLNRRA